MADTGRIRTPAINKSRCLDTCSENKSGFGTDVTSIDGSNCISSHNLSGPKTNINRSVNRADIKPYTHRKHGNWYNRSENGSDDRPAVFHIGNNCVEVESPGDTKATHKIFMSPDREGRCSMFAVARTGTNAQSFMVNPTEPNALNVRPASMSIVPPAKHSKTLAASKRKKRSMSNPRNTTKSVLTQRKKVVHKTAAAKTIRTTPILRSLLTSAPAHMHASVSPSYINDSPDGEWVDTDLTSVSSMLRTVTSFTLPTRSQSPPLCLNTFGTCKSIEHVQGKKEHHVYTGPTGGKAENHDTTITPMVNVPCSSDGKSLVKSQNPPIAVTKAMTMVKSIGVPLTFNWTRVSPTVRWSSHTSVTTTSSVVKRVTTCRTTCGKQLDSVSTKSSVSTRAIASTHTCSTLVASANRNSLAGTLVPASTSTCRTHVASVTRKSSVGTHVTASTPTCNTHITSVTGKSSVGTPVTASTPKCTTHVASVTSKSTVGSRVTASTPKFTTHVTSVTSTSSVGTHVTAGIATVNTRVASVTTTSSVGTRVYAGTTTGNTLVTRLTTKSSTETPFTTSSRVTQVTRSCQPPSTITPSADRFPQYRQTVQSVVPLQQEHDIHTRMSLQYSNVPVPHYAMNSVQIHKPVSSYRVKAPNPSTLYARQYAPIVPFSMPLIYGTEKRRLLMDNATLSATQDATTHINQSGIITGKEHQAHANNTLTNDIVLSGSKVSVAAAPADKSLKLHRTSFKCISIPVTEQIVSKNNPISITSASKESSDVEPVLSATHIDNQQLLVKQPYNTPGMKRNKRFNKIAKSLERDKSRINDQCFKRSQQILSSAFKKNKSFSNRQTVRVKYRPKSVATVNNKENTGDMDVSPIYNNSVESQLAQTQTVCSAEDCTKRDTCTSGHLNPSIDTPMDEQTTNIRIESVFSLANNVWDEGNRTDLAKQPTSPSDMCNMDTPQASHCQTNSSNKDSHNSDARKVKCCYVVMSKFKHDPNIKEYSPNANTLQIASTNSNCSRKCKVQFLKEYLSRKSDANLFDQCTETPMINAQNSADIVCRTGIGDDVCTKVCDLLLEKRESHMAQVTNSLSMPTPMHAEQLIPIPSPQINVVHDKQLPSTVTNQCVQIQLQEQCSTVRLTNSSSQNQHTHDSAEHATGHICVTKGQCDQHRPDPDLGMVSRHRFYPVNIEGSIVPLKSESNATDSVPDNHSSRMHITSEWMCGHGPEPLLPHDKLSRRGNFSVSSLAGTSLNQEAHAQPKKENCMSDDLTEICQRIQVSRTLTGESQSYATAQDTIVIKSEPVYCEYTCNVNETRPLSKMHAKEEHIHASSSNTLGATDSSSPKRRCIINTSNNLPKRQHTSFNELSSLKCKDIQIMNVSVANETLEHVEDAHVTESSTVCESAVCISNNGNKIRRLKEKLKAQIEMLNDFTRTKRCADRKQ